MGESAELSALEAGRGQVLEAFARMHAAELDGAEAAGEWTAWEIAYHLLDIERWYIAKLCEAAAADRVEALARFMAVWARLRDETLALAHDLPPERLDVAGLLSGVPDWTPRSLLDAIAAHDREHAAQIGAARRGTRTGGAATGSS